MSIIKTITLKHISGAVPEQNKESFIHSLGMLDGAFIVVIGYSAAHQEVNRKVKSYTKN